MVNLAKLFRFVQCEECGRAFDLAHESDAAEWFSGHDCESAE